MNIRILSDKSYAKLVNKLGPRVQFVQVQVQNIYIECIKDSEPPFTALILPACTASKFITDLSDKLEKIRGSLTGETKE